MVASQSKVIPMETTWGASASKSGKKNKDPEETNKKTFKAKNMKNGITSQSLPLKSLKKMVFLHPPNFDQRNKKLIEIITNECDGNSAKFKKCVFYVW